MTSAGAQSRAVDEPWRASVAIAAHITTPIAVIGMRRPAGSERSHAIAVSAAKYTKDTHSEDRMCGVVCG